MCSLKFFARIISSRLLLLNLLRSEIFTLKNISPNVKSSVEIINSIGDVLYRENIFGKDEYVIEAKLPAGIYLVKVYNEEKITVGKLLVK